VTNAQRRRRRFLRRLRFDLTILAAAILAYATIAWAMHGMLAS